MADLPGGDLVDRDAQVQPGAERLPRVAAGEERGAGAGVVAGAVAPVVGGVVRQVGDDLKLVSHVGRGLKRFVQLVVAALALGQPALVVRTVGKRDEAHPQRHAAGGRRQSVQAAGAAARDERSDERFERRQRDADAQAAEKCTAFDFACHHALLISTVIRILCLGLSSSTAVIRLAHDRDGGGRRSLVAIAD